MLHFGIRGGLSAVKYNPDPVNASEKKGINLEDLTSVNHIFMMHTNTLLLCILMAPAAVSIAQTPLASANRVNFEAQTIDSNVTVGYGIALGDVDGDKKTDILLADAKQFVWYRNGDWKKFVMIENLTENDNVCIAAEDIDGDGKVEVAVGAQWDPGETKDEKRSGSVHFLVRPADPTARWNAVELYHEPTIHRMRWFKASDGNYYLLVLPLHGKGNEGARGTPVNLLVFKYPELLKQPAPAAKLGTNMHATHNLDIADGVYIAGKEGIGIIAGALNESSKLTNYPLPVDKNGVGEIRFGKKARTDFLIATIEPMHGRNLVVYEGKHQKTVLDTALNEGHALALADIAGLGNEQVVAGWRGADKDGNTGIKLYFKNGGSGWQWQWVDKNGIACEDLKAIDLDGDNKIDILGAGRKTRNLKVYWNKGQ
jgi:hypothetical protein